MTLNKWFMLMALFFGSMEAMATLKATPAVNSSEVIERSTLVYANALAVEYPAQNLSIKVDSSVLNATQILQIQKELFVFEQVMRGELPVEAAKNFKFIACGMPCGGGGGGCKPPTCRSQYNEADRP